MRKALVSSLESDVVKWSDSSPAVRVPTSLFQIIWLELLNSVAEEAQ